jgi:ABC-2 type transport system ATP-binding protein
MIELNNFTKVYGEFVAVSNLNLKIGAGEMFGFIGPNGAGKSTTIRFLATLLRATAGEGTVNGCSVTVIHRRLQASARDNFMSTTA